MKFDEVPWHVPVSKRDDIDWSYEPGDDEAGRKFLVEGQGGFWMQAVRIPPGFTVPEPRDGDALTEDEDPLDPSDLLAAGLTDHD